MEGRCQCGAVRFTTPLAQPLKVFVCHCLECRRQSASAFGVSAIFPAFDLYAAAAAAAAAHDLQQDKRVLLSAATGQVSDATTVATTTTTTDSTSPANIGVYSHHNTTSGRRKECYFCRTCGVRIMHGGSDHVAVKGGCLEALDGEMLKGAIHIWTKRAIFPIPSGVESYPEDPA
jgi:hypothetical protein